MRSFIYTVAVLLLSLLLLYGGLNVVERSMAELLALEREPGAFVLDRREGAFVVTFGGGTFSLCLQETLAGLRSWWEKLPFTSPNS